jgi:hypothetical protein
MLASTGAGGWTCHTPALFDHPVYPATSTRAATEITLSWCQNSDQFDIEEYPDPQSVYQATFDAPPGPGVSILQAYGRAFRDSSTCYLRLKATPTAFGALTAIGFTPITADDYRTKIQGGSIRGPLLSWWNPLTDSPTVFLYSGTFHPGFTSGQAIVAYEPTVQIVNFYWDGLD